MKIRRIIGMGLMLAGLQGAACHAQPVVAEVALNHDSQTLRPQVHALLKAAQEHLRQKKSKLALKKLADVDAFPGLTERERFLQARISVDVADLSGDKDAMIKALLVVIPSPHLSVQEKGQFEQALVVAYYSTKQYGRLIDTMSADILAWRNPEFIELLVSAYIHSGDFKNAAQVQRAFLLSPEGAQDAASASAWQMLARSCSEIHDSECYLEALEKVAALEYSSIYIEEILLKTAAKAKYADRLQVEIYRLRQQLKPLQTAELIDFIRLLLEDGAPREATVQIEAAFKSGALGKGADAPRHERLKALVAKEHARATTQPDSILNHYRNVRQFDKIVEIGYDMVHAGQAGNGVELIESAIAGGEIRDLAVAKLHLGLAYAAARRQEDAMAQLGSIPGDEDLARLGRLWLIQNKQAARAKPR